MNNNRLKWKDVNQKTINKIQHLLSHSGHKLIIKFNDIKQALDVFIKDIKTKN
jgi:hypothetical protein